LTESITPSPIVRAKGLTKLYGEFGAVNGIDFAIEEGECFGFLGPNGAGKTTTMKMITCNSPVTSGLLEVDGLNVAKDARAIKRSLGVVSQADSLDPGLNVYQNLISFCRFFNMGRSQAHRAATDALELFHLADRAKSSPDELSGGMRRRLLIARALLHGPKLLVLDEPTTGLDPQNRLVVWERLMLLKSQGKTILLTTHYMDEAAYLCDRLVVMDSGKILVEGPPSKLVREHVGEQVLEIRVPLPQKAGFVQMLTQKSMDFEDHGDSVFLYGEHGANARQNVRLDGLLVIDRPGNLEDLFLRLTGRGLREG
jgi:lipooligosaccharide transport system ATP-binding protein